MAKIWPFTKKKSEPFQPVGWPVFPETITPYSSCANCAWLRQGYVSQDGQYYAVAEEVSEYQRWAGLKYHDPYLWKGKYFSWPECAVRGKDLGQEVQDVVARPWNFDPDGYKVVVRRDRSEGSEFSCGRFYPWNPRYTFEQHWEERRMLLLDESNKRFAREINDAANRTQRWIAFFAAVAIAVAIIVPVWISSGASTTEINGPVVVVTPMPATATPVSP